MKSPLLKPLLPVALALLPIFGLTGCLEESTVVKVREDGSGVIHVRNYQNDQAVGGLLGGLGGPEEKPAEEKEPDGPTEEELKQQAKAMGEGVTFEKIVRGKNKSGWSGYEAIFAFADINKVQLEMKPTGSSQLEGSDLEQEAQDEGEIDESELIRFAMKDGLLTITAPDPEDAEAPGEGEAEGEEDPIDGAQDPFAGDMQNPQMMAMMAAMFAGAKMGFFVEIDGEISEANAKHQNGSMITIMRADLGKLFSDAEGIKKMQGLEGNTREDVQKIIDGIDGVDVDLQDPITVKFK